MVDRCMRTDSSRCDPSRITLDLWYLVIWLGSQLEESFLTHLSTIWFSLIHPRKLSLRPASYYDLTRTKDPRIGYRDWYRNNLYIYSKVHWFGGHLGMACFFVLLLTSAKAVSRMSNWSLIVHLVMILIYMPHIL